MRKSSLGRGWIAGALLLAAGLGMMGFGALRGEPLTVLKKAVTICLECIGIG